MIRCGNKGIWSLILSLVAATVMAADNGPSGREVKVLAVGNSFSVNAKQYFNDFNQEDPAHKLTMKVAYIPGCPLDLHVKLARKHEADPNDPAGKPYPDGANGKSSLKTLLLEQPWDIITIQQASWQSADINSYRPHAAVLVEYIRKYCPNTPIMVHETWAYRNDDPIFRSGNYSSEMMYQKLHAAYRTIADELGKLKLIPVGSAFNKANNRSDWQFAADPAFKPEQMVYPQVPQQPHSLNIGWYWEKSGDGHKLKMDGHHANDAGCYLAGLVWREKILGIDAREIRFRPANISERDAAVLREVAHETVKTEL